MIENFFTEINSSDIIIALFSTLIGFSIVFWLFRPRLKITNARINTTNVWVDVVNKGLWSAVNLQIEMCVLIENYTYHYKVDRDSFLILPPNVCGLDNVRTFKTCFIENDCFEDPANQNFNWEKNYVLRVRVHAAHSVSGLGRAFEQQFKYINGNFYPIHRKCFFCMRFCA
jgi:hypothetical protein